MFFLLKGTMAKSSNKTQSDWSCLHFVDSFFFLAVQKAWKSFRSQNSLKKFAPENRPKLPRNETSCNHWFSDFSGLLRLTHILIGAPFYRTIAESSLSRREAGNYQRGSNSRCISTYKMCCSPCCQGSLNGTRLEVHQTMQQIYGNFEGFSLVVYIAFFGLVV